MNLPSEGTRRSGSPHAAQMVSSSEEVPPKFSLSAHKTWLWVRISGCLYSGYCFSIAVMVPGTAA